MSTKLSYNIFFKQKTPYFVVLDLFMEEKMADITIVCKDCGNEFVFTDGEQQFYNEKGFSQPVRCKECRQAAKLRREAKKVESQE